MIYDGMYGGTTEFLDTPHAIMSGAGFYASSCCFLKFKAGCGLRDQALFTNLLGGG